MFLIPGQLVAVLTFPGVIVHEIAHRFFADLADVPVYEVKYFQLDDVSGYVLHGKCETLKSAFFISVGPFIVNTLLCSIITFTAVVPIFILKVNNFNPLFLVMIWLGFSIGMHAIPSEQDTKNLIVQVKSKKKTNSIFGIFSFVFAAVFSIANVLKRIWFDAFYAYAVSMVLPYLYFNLIVSLT